MELRGMLGPVPAPVIIQADLYCLKLLVNTFGEEFLNAGIFGEGDMWTNVKEKSALETEGCRVTAVIRVLVVHYRGDALGVEAVSCTEPGHSGSQDDDVWGWHLSTSPYFLASVRVMALEARRVSGDSTCWLKFCARTS